MKSLSMQTLRPIMVFPSVALLLSTSSCSEATTSPVRTVGRYTRTDLASNQIGAARDTDSRLVNAWGLVQRGKGPFWISDAGTGLSTLYDGTGARLPLVVSVPPAPGSSAGTLGTPTGIVGNVSLTDFTITENGVSGPAFFIFATLDGTISAWNPIVGPSQATVAADRSSVGAVYTGLAIATNGGSQFLYAADDGANRRIDMFDANFAFVKSFGDPNIPTAFAPYGIQTINGEVWVTYAPLTKGQGGGFVDIFHADGSLKKEFAAAGPLDSPWGLAQAPADFGPLSNAILVSNNRPGGRINAFDPTSGAFLGQLGDASGKPIEIDEVWALEFGHDDGPHTAHNQLFFTAGPNNFANGLLGVITVGP